MPIELITTPKEDFKFHKTYFISKEVVNEIEGLKKETRSKNYEELFTKMVGVTREELKKQQSKQKSQKR